MKLFNLIAFVLFFSVISLHSKYGIDFVSPVNQEPIVGYDILDSTPYKAGLNRKPSQAGMQFSLDHIGPQEVNSFQVPSKQSRIKKNSNKKSIGCYSIRRKLARNFSQKEKSK